MSDEEHVEETLAEFKNSFSYGSRPDLSFKFMKALPTDVAAEFLQGIITLAGELIDTGDPERLIAHITTGQEYGYNRPTTWQYDDGPFTPMAKPLGEAKLGLITSTGHFVKGQDPQPFGVVNMSQEEAVARINDFLKEAPDLSQIPTDLGQDQLDVRHGGYDIRGVQVDRNVALPIDRLNELDREGVIGSLASPAYSFVGAAAQRRLLKESIPGWIETLNAAELDGLILVPV